MSRFRKAEEPLHWLVDYQECLEGDHGEWWRQRAERAIEDSEFTDHDPSWPVWRTIRQTEMAP